MGVDSGKYEGHCVLRCGYM